MKVSMHSYLPNAPINLRLNFNFEKLVKRETPLCSSAKVGLKLVGNIFGMSQKFACMLVHQIGIQIYEQI